MCITSSFCIHRRQENEYLEFVAGVTRDILARGVLSDLAMALLFQSHIERHRHRLRVVSWQTLACPGMQQTGVGEDLGLSSHSPTLSHV